MLLSLSGDLPVATEHSTAGTQQRFVQLPAGANQSGVRAHNERLVLSQLRVRGALSKAELARQTGLSAQAISVIIRNLEADGLLARGALTRGKVGQPSTPMTLNPDGAYSVGLRLGRRSSDLALMDFTGTIRKTIKVTHPYPTPERIMSFTKLKLPELLSNIDESHVLGIGIGAPFQLYNWLDRLGAPKDQMSAWREFDLAAALEDQSGFPTMLVNDATCACVAEHAIGAGQELDDFAYFFVGSFIGGGIVMNGAVQTGHTGNAAAFGPIPSASAENPDGQLIDTASLFLLERALASAGVDAAPMWQKNNDWSALEPHVGQWIKTTAPALAQASLTVCAIIDFPTVVIDGGFPANVRKTLVTAINDAMARLNTEGVVVPNLIEGKAGAEARALGAAMLPINERFFVNRLK